MRWNVNKYRGQMNRTYQCLLVSDHQNEVCAVVAAAAAPAAAVDMGGSLAAS
jgi:hypothetical protein